MKSWFSRGMLAAAIALPALSGAAWAGGSDDYGCSNATLKGEYAFGVTAYTPPVFSNGPPQVVAGIKVFDGKGNSRSGITEATAFAAPISRRQGRKTAPTLVNPDCTGSMVINLNVPDVLQHVPRGHKQSCS